MKEETKHWLKYSEDNLDAAIILLENHLYNPSLHNIQQSVEKAIKSVFIEYGVKLKKSHNINELRNILKENEITKKCISIANRVLEEIKHKLSE